MPNLQYDEIQMDKNDNTLKVSIIITSTQSLHKNCRKCYLYFFKEKYKKVVFLNSVI